MVLPLRGSPKNFSGCIRFSSETAVLVAALVMTERKLVQQIAVGGISSISSKPAAGRATRAGDEGRFDARAISAWLSSAGRDRRRRNATAEGADGLPATIVKRQLLLMASCQGGAGCQRPA